MLYNFSLLSSPIIWGWQIYLLFFRWPACKIHRRTSHGSRRFWFGFGFIYRTSKSFRENRRLFYFAYEESKRVGLEEAVVNQATVWPESGADRTASSRENPVPSTAPNQYNPNSIFQIGNGFGFFLFFLSQRYNTLDLASRVWCAKRLRPLRILADLICGKTSTFFIQGYPFIEEYGILGSINRNC